MSQFPTADSPQMTACVARRGPETSVATSHPFAQTAWILPSDLMNAHQLLCDITEQTGLAQGVGCVDYALGETGQQILRDMATLVGSRPTWPSSATGTNMARLVNIFLLFMGAKRSSIILHATASKIRPLGHSQLSFSARSAFNVNACDAPGAVRFVPVLSISGAGSLADVGDEDVSIPASSAANWFAASVVEFGESGRTRFSFQMFETSQNSSELVSRIDVLLPRPPGLPRGMVRTPPRLLQLPLEPPREVQLSGGSRGLVCYTVEDVLAKNPAPTYYASPVPSADIVAAVSASQTPFRAPAQLRCPDFGGGVIMRRSAMPGESGANASVVDCMYNESTLPDAAAANSLLASQTMPALSVDMLMSKFCAEHDPGTGEGCPTYSLPPRDGQPACPAALRTNSVCARWIAGRPLQAAADASARSFCDKWPGHPACDCIKWDDTQSAQSPARSGAYGAIDLHTAPLRCWFAPCKRTVHSRDRYLQLGDPAEDRTCPTITCQQLIGAFSRSGNATVEIIDSTIGISQCETERKAAESDTSAGNNPDRICAGGICTPCVDRVSCTCTVEEGTKQCIPIPIDKNVTNPKQEEVKKDDEELESKKNEMFKLLAVLLTCALVTGALIGWLASVASSRRGGGGRRGGVR
jgi:hypothetical protein